MIQAEEAQKRAFGFPDISRDVHLKGRNETTLRPLIADLFHAFAEKAMVLLAETHPSLIPLKITDDSTRIPILAAFVQSIPIEVYESWGLPGYQQVIGKRFAKVRSNNIYG